MSEIQMPATVQIESDEQKHDEDDVIIRCNLDEGASFFDQGKIILGYN